MILQAKKFSFCIVGKKQLHNMTRYCHVIVVYCFRGDDLCKL